jgi:predicted enzyme related to lactoylglutathione lyase
MQRVIGVGGIFFKANDPEKLAAWYKKHLGLNVEEWGGVTFQEGAGADLQPKRQGYIAWSPFEADTVYFEPSTKPYMLNFRVHDLHALLEELRREGVDVDEKTEESDFGKFGWLMDPEGTRIELWEPPIAKHV